ncbi:MAG: sulfite exporter TauE/SafE family protein [Polyangiales bacterium]
MRVDRNRSANELVSLTRRRRESYVASRFRKIRDRTLDAATKHPYFTGMASVFLPCGALVAALAIAAGLHTPLAGFMVMVSFALVSGVGLVAAGWMARRFSISSNLFLRHALALALALGAIVFVFRPFHDHGHGHHEGVEAIFYSAHPNSHLGSDAAERPSDQSGPHAEGHAGGHADSHSHSSSPDSSEAMHGH